MLAARHPGVAPAKLIRKFLREISDMDEGAAELLSSVDSGG
jgi:hypothetical protein